MIRLILLHYYRVATTTECCSFRRMAEPVIDGNDYDLHHQFSIVDGATPLSHSDSNSDSSSINPFSSPTSPPHGWMINQLSRSDGLPVDTMTPESKLITTKFTLPEDWLVEKKPRPSGNTHDKYYRDPETRRKFRSLKDVERYLREGFVPTRSNTNGLNYHEKKSSSQKKIVSSGKMSLKSKLITTKFTLPEDWLVEKRPRPSGNTHDTYYRDPETGRKFRSLKDVERYLREGFVPTRSNTKGLNYHKKKSSSQKKIVTSGKVTPESKLITTKFTLPEDWLVEKKPRPSGNTHDTYYRDPETGRKFRSLKDVESYLREGFVPARSNTKGRNYHEKKSSSQKKIVSGGKVSLLSTSPFKLPDGWIVEEVPRKAGDYIDKYYYEPGTGHRFRSLLSVQTHLAQLEENSPLSVILEELRENKLPISKAFKLANPIKNYGSYDSWKRSISKKEQDSSFSNAPPSKIDWVLPSTPGETWNAFVGDELVPESMKQLWGKRFMLVINNQQLFTVSENN